MNTDRTRKIASIIEKRRPLVNKIADTEANLKSLSSELKNLEAYRNELLTRVEDCNVKQSLQELDFTEIHKKIDDECQKIGTLRERISRHTLNIGVIGFMGQGKSTLLKSLSGLTDNEIPALKGGACTAVRSTIENHQGEIVTEVIIHSENSFLEEVIYPYYKELGLENKPLNLNDFALQKFPQTQVIDANATNERASATNERMYKHLKDDYHSNINQYQHLLQPGLPRRLIIKKEEISKYVIQKRDHYDNLLTFEHLAVREVKILCPFKNSDVGQISLVDLPGLGDSKLGDED